MADDRTYLREYYLNLVPDPLDAGSAWYVPVYERLCAADPTAEDPVDLLAQQVFFSTDASIHLFSGFIGTGKSTELRRLRRRLEGDGNLVLLIDMEPLLNPTAPLDITVFLTRLAGGVENEAIAQRYIDASTTRPRFSERLVDFLDRVGFDFARFKLDAKVASVEIEGRLRKDDSFREAVQASLAGSLLQLSTEVTDYLTTIISEMKDRSGTSNVVVIVDSVEKLRDTEQTDGAVMRSVRTVFARHCDLLRVPGAQTIYTAPPDLEVWEGPAVAANFDAGAQKLGAVRLATRSGDDYEPGLRILCEVVKARAPEGDWERLFGGDEQVERLARMSGGHIRQLLLAVRETIIRTTTLPASPETIEAAIRQLRRAFGVLADDQVEWLRHVRDHRRPPITTDADRERFTHALDALMVFMYRNGDEWYGVNPLLDAELDANARP
jgi:hypothetical protein